MNILLIGAPLSGKSTIAKTFCKRNPDFKALSMNDIVRNEMLCRTPVGIAMEAMVQNHQSFPAGVMAALLAEKMEGSKNNIIFDFPTNARQAREFDDTLRRKGHRIDAAVYLHVDRDTLLARGERRWVCPKCKKEWDTMLNPSFNCGDCGTRLVHRRSDSRDELNERIDAFLRHNNTADHYEERSKLFTIQQTGVSHAAEILRAIVEGHNMKGSGMRFQRHHSGAYICDSCPRRCRTFDGKRFAVDVSVSFGPIYQTNGSCAMCGEELSVGLLVKW